MASSSTKKWYRLDVVASERCTLRVYADSKKNALAQLNSEVELDPKTPDFGDQLYQQLDEMRPKDFSLNWMYNTLVVDDDQEDDV